MWGVLSLHGTIHIIAATILFISVAATCFVMVRRFAGDSNWKCWALYSLITGIVVIVFDAASQLNASQLPGSPAGLLQRIAIIASWAWIALFAIRLFIIYTKRSKV